MEDKIKVTSTQLIHFLVDNVYDATLPSDNLTRETNVAIIKRVYVADYCSFSKLSNGHYIRVSESYFQTLHINLLRQDKPVTVTLCDCQIDEMIISGGNNISVHLSNCRIKSLIVDNPIEHLNILNTDYVEIGNISIKFQDTQESERTFSFEATGLVVELLSINSNRIRVDIDLSRILSLSYWPKKESRLYISEKTVISTLEVSKMEGALHITESTIEKLIFRYPPDNVTESVVFIENSDVNNIELTLRVQIKWFTLINCHVSHFYFDFAEIENIQINSGWYELLECNLERFRFDVLNVVGVNMNALIFRDGVIFEGLTRRFATVQLEEISLRALVFSSVINQTSLFLASGLKIEDLRNESTKSNLVYNDITNATNAISKVLIRDGLQFSIKNSDLGKINFISCDFLNAQLWLVGSKIVEIFLSGTEMPAKVYGESQIGYSQLKKVYENRGDSVRSNEYLSYELEAHHDALGSKSRSWTDFFDLITLKANKYSNQFNQSWALVIAGGLPVMGLIYWVYCWYLGYSSTWDGNPDNIATFWRLFSLFPEFIYPIHIADYVPKVLGIELVGISNGARVVEFIGRAVNGYFFYQFIQAFRKYGKK